MPVSCLSYQMVNKIIPGKTRIYVKFIFKLFPKLKFSDSEAIWILHLEVLHYDLFFGTLLNEGQLISSMHLPCGSMGDHETIF